MSFFSLPLVFDKHIQSNLTASNGSVIMQSANNIELQAVNLNAKDTIEMPKIT